MLTTWRFRIKDSGHEGTILQKMSRAVNKVWNLCKETQVKALKVNDLKKVVDKNGTEKEVKNYLSSYELDTLFSGRSKEFGLHSQTLQAITKEYATRVRQFKKTLRWRSRNYKGWIPFKASGIKIDKDSVFYCKEKLDFWKSREFPEDAKFKTGSFNQDNRGRWYVSFTFNTESIKSDKGIAILGGDIGIKTLLSLSDGTKLERPNLRKDFLVKLIRLEKTRRYARRMQARTKKYKKLPHDKQQKNLYAKVANARQDYLHKESTKLISRIDTLVIGDVKCKFMNRSKNLSGISLDSGIGMFKTMLHFKAKRAGATFLEISERYSTQTCSYCGWQHSRENRIGLGVRMWVCPNCRNQHDRDINAARNILAKYQTSSRMGHHAPTRSIEQSSLLSLCYLGNPSLQNTT